MKHLANPNSREFTIIDGDGCFVVDRDGKRYVDFLAGWCVGNVGWKHHEVIQAIKRQADQGIYVAPWFHYDPWETFAKRLVELAPGKKLQRVWRCPSGSEAVELAIKSARAATGKRTIVSLERVYHGHTYGAASVGNAMTKAIEPGVPGMVHLPLPDEYRGITSDDVISRFEQLIHANNDIAAFISEPVFSNAGVIVPPRHFYESIQNLCRQHGILLIMDEVATGFGRCGALFASSLWGLEPDILCLGKGMTGGYGALGATLVTEEIYQRSQDLPMISTFGWTPQDLVAAQTVVEIIVRERLWENSHAMGMYITEQLRQLEGRSFIGQVRNAGLLIGVAIVKNKESKEPDAKKAEAIVATCLHNGLLIDTADNVLFLSPPLIIDKQIADQGIGVLTKAIEAA